MGEFFRNIGAFFENMFSSPWTVVADILDIALLAVFIYVVIKFVRDTRAFQLLKGIVLLLVLLGVTELLSLTASHYILSQLIEFGMLAVIIVFQPELRSMLERFGRRSFKPIAMSFRDGENDETTLNAIKHICDAVANLSATKTGALIVIENETRLGEIIKTGVELDAEVSTELITNIFYPKAPLHDGAMIIRDFRIRAAGCFLPLSSNHLGSELGTRHRAALGVSEISDSMTIIVSEETGIISIAKGGSLFRRISPESLKASLKKYFIPEKEEKKKENILTNLWRGKKK